MEENIEKTEIDQSVSLDKSDQFIPYLNQIKDISLLSFEQERTLSLLIRERLAIIEAISDEKARSNAEKNDEILDKAIKELTTPNLRLVIKEAVDLYRKSNISIKDLIGYGNLGLVKAAYKYDADKFNTKFSTYATYHIRNEMYIFVNNSHVVTIPFHIIELRQKYNKITDGNKGISDSELMEELEVTQKNLQRARDSNVSSISLSHIVRSHNNDNNQITVGDLIADEGDSPLDAIEKKDKYNILMEALQELDPISRDIVCSQLLDAEKSSLEKLGEKHNVSSEYVRQLKEKALLRLKRIINRKSI